MVRSHEHFMELALEEARKGESEGNVPVGSVIVRGDEVVASGRNLVNSTHDVTAHAETVALRNCTQALKKVDLSGYTLYTTMEPCPMCCGAIMYSRISALVLGARLKDTDPSPTCGPYAVEKLLELAQWGPRLRLVTGVLQKQCEEIRLRWLNKQSHR